MISLPAMRYATPLVLAIALAPAASSADQNDKEITLYVSALHGDDAWSGGIAAPNAAGTDGPLASFEGARRAVRAIDKSGLHRITVLFRGQSEPAQATSVVDSARMPSIVSLVNTISSTGNLVTKASYTAPRRDQEGVYRLTAPVVLGPEDSGSALIEIAYRNFPGEFPVFSGGVRVRNWHNVGANRWQAELPSGTQKFENLFYNGERRLRPRLAGYLGPYRRVWKQVADLNGNPSVCPPGDGPNGYECFDRFDYNPNSDPQYLTDLEPQSWGNLVPAAGNQCNQSAGAEALQGEIEVLIFEQFSTSKLRVSCVDLAKQRVFFTGPTAVPGPNNASEAGFIVGNRYIVENVKSALTEPGQWFLDTGQSPMTLTYLAQNGEDPNRDEVIIPQTNQLLVAHDVHNVTIRGLVFEHDNYVVPPAGHQSTELEPDATSAISFQNAHHITVEGIIVRHTSGNGLDFISCLQQSTQQVTISPKWCQTYSRDAVTAYNTVTNSIFYDLGVNGIRVGENNNTALDALTTDKNVPQHFLVQNNVVSGYGRVIPAAFGIGQGVGHDNAYLYNDVYDGYHCAISISHGGGDNTTAAGNANNTIAFNHVHDLLQGIMNDGGSIRIESGNATFTAPGNRIFNNKIHDTSDASALDNPNIVINHTNVRPGYGGDGIYLDNSTGLVDVENNLLYRVSGNAVYTPHGPQQSLPEAPWGHGQSNLIKNNILAYARKGIISVNDPYYTQSSNPFIANPVFLFTSNIAYFDRDDSETAAPFYVQTDCTFPGTLSFAQFQTFERNLYWRVDGAFANYDKAFHIQAHGTGPSPCSKQPADWQFYYFNNPPTPAGKSWQADAHEDASSTADVDPRFLHPTYPFDDYSLMHGSPNAFFVPFDTRTPGRQPPFSFFVPPTVRPTFILAPFDPRKDF